MAVLARCLQSGALESQESPESWPRQDRPVPGIRCQEGRAADGCIGRGGPDIGRAFLGQGDATRPQPGAESRSQSQEAAEGQRSQSPSMDYMGEGAQETLPSGTQTTPEQPCPIGQGYVRGVGPTTESTGGSQTSGRGGTTGRAGRAFSGGDGCGCFLCGTRPTGRSLGSLGRLFQRGGAAEGYAGSAPFGCSCALSCFRSGTPDPSAQASSSSHTSTSSASPTGLGRQNRGQHTFAAFPASGSTVFTAHNEFGTAECSLAGHNHGPLPVRGRHKSGQWTTAVGGRCTTVGGAYASSYNQASSCTSPNSSERFSQAARPSEDAECGTKQRSLAGTEAIRSTTTASAESSRWGGSRWNRPYTGSCEVLFDLRRRGQGRGWSGQFRGHGLRRWLASMSLPEDEGIPCFPTRALGQVLVLGPPWMQQGLLPDLGRYRSPVHTACLANFCEGFSGHKGFSAWGFSVLPLFDPLSLLLFPLFLQGRMSYQLTLRSLSAVCLALPAIVAHVSNGPLAFATIGYLPECSVEHYSGFETYTLPATWPSRLPTDQHLRGRTAHAWCSPPAFPLPPTPAGLASRIDGQTLGAPWFCRQAWPRLTPNLAATPSTGPSQSPSNIPGQWRRDCISLREICFYVSAVASHLTLLDVRSTFLCQGRPVSSPI